MNRKNLMVLLSVLLWSSLFIVIAVYATDFSSDTYDTATPAGSDDPSEADDRMRETKSSVRVRENVDHYWPLTGTEVSDADTGEHRKVLFHEPIASTPTVAANHGDLRIKDVANGSDTLAELVFTNESEEELQLSSSGNNLANNTWLTATNVAGTTSVNLIKAATTDEAMLAGGTRFPTGSSTPVNAVDVASKGYVDDTVDDNIGIVQVVNTQTGAVNTGTTAIPDDDTIPQITEGDEYMTLAITPSSATTKLRIDVQIQIAASAGSVMTVALFQDTTVGALAAVRQQTDIAHLQAISLTHFMTSDTAIETTFRVRAGGTSGTNTFNGVGGSRKLGGVLASSITITEIKD